MKIIIHRGTNQIGGCVTEISTNDTRIFIDLGSPLPDEYGNVVMETLSIDGLTSGVINCDAVLFTHNHGDHIGMLSKILPDIKFYMGKAAKDIYYILQKRMRDGIPDIVKMANTFEVGQKFAIRDFLITPIAVDHSAFDAYMFLVEAEGKRILHTGDFRMHGVRGKELISALKKYVGQVDVLITEGTMLSRNDTATISEDELQNKARNFLNAYKYVFVICSSTNIDRIGAFHEATPRGKYFICDNYQNEIINVVRGFAGEHETLYQFKKALTYGDNLSDRMKTRGFCMIVRSGDAFHKIMKYYKENHNDDTLIIYSMWNGHLKQENKPLELLMEGFKNVQFLHTSGHATKQTIIDVCNSVSPRQAIIPIHSDNPQILGSLGLKFNIKYLSDGEPYNL